MNLSKPCRLFCIIFWLALSALQPAAAYEIPADWETFVGSWLQSNPAHLQASRNFAVLKEKLSRESRNKLIEMTIQMHLNPEFGKNASLITVFGIHKLIEAMQQNRLDDALKHGALLAVAREIPILGKYIKTLQTVEKGFQFVEQVIENDLYKSRAYTNLVSIVMPSLDCLSRFKNTEKYFPRRPDAWIPPPPFDQARAYGKAPYIPSFLIKFDPGSPQAALLESLRQHMLRWEEVFYKEWSAKDEAHREAVRKLEMAPLAAQVRSVYKQVLTPRQLFNRFLMRIVASDQWRRITLENMHTCYLRPAGSKIAREAAEKLAKTISDALQNSVNSADGWAEIDKQQMEAKALSRSAKKHKPVSEDNLTASAQMSAEKLAELIMSDKDAAAGVLQQAIDNGFNVNQSIPGSDEKLLHVAAAAGAERILAILLSRGANVDGKDAFGETALCKAVSYDQENSHYNIVKILLGSGADPNNRDLSGGKPLDIASFGTKAAVAIRAAGGYRDVSPTGFIEACQTGTVELINDYIKAGGDVNQSFSGISALMFAVANGSEDSVRALLKAGVRVGSADRNGMTALHWAALFNHTRIADILLQNGVKASVKDNRGNTAGYYQYWKHGKNASLAARLGYTVPRDRAREQAASARAFNEAFSALALGMKMGLEESARQSQLQQQAAQKAAASKAKVTLPQSMIGPGNIPPLKFPSSSTADSRSSASSVSPSLPKQQPQSSTVYWVVVDRQSSGGGNLRNSARVLTGGNPPVSGFSQQISTRQWKKLTWVYGTLDASDARQYADRANQQQVSIPLTVKTEPAGNHGWVYRTDHRLPVVVLTAAADRFLKSKPGYVRPIAVK
ncbi:MAG: ankyrin repeat domain-containing protein [Candidatus Riflebacteria bacterium]|nr:ankyrin repeat domain-containing protein [Candidatus Riflebacteria bacterium]